MLQRLSAAETTPVINIVDDDDTVCDSLVDLFGSFGILANAFGGPAEFLAGFDPQRPGCILLDVNMPGLNGLELQAKLSEMGCRHPVVFMTGIADVTVSVDAMKAGATDFLLKPFDGGKVVAAAMHAIRLDAERRSASQLAEEARRRAEKLTPREREVFKYVADGLLNKQIAHELGVSEIMVKLHRGRMMKKMGCRSLIDLVRRYDLLVSTAPGGPTSTN